MGNTTVEQRMLDAAWNQDWKTVRAALAAKANINARDRGGKTVLHYAAWRTTRDAPAIVKLLLARGADPRIRDIERDLPIHDACFRGAPLAVVQSLVEAAPETVNARGFVRLTPLHRACDRSSDHVVAFLLARGADPNQKSGVNKTAFQHAQKARIRALLMGSAPQKRASKPTVADPEPPKAMPLHGTLAPLTSFATWRAASAKTRAATANAVVERGRGRWKRAKVSGSELSVVEHVETGMLFLVVPGGGFLSGVTSRDLAALSKIDLSDELEASIKVRIKVAVLSPYLYARAPLLVRDTRSLGLSYQGTMMGRAEATEAALFTRAQASIATRHLARLGLRLPTPLEWEFAARDGGEHTFVGANDERGAERACAHLHHSGFANTRSPAWSALGLWGLGLGEWLVAKDRRVTLASGSSAQSYPWQHADEIVSCIAGQSITRPWADLVVCVRPVADI